MSRRSSRPAFVQGAKRKRACPATDACDSEDDLRIKPGCAQDKSSHQPNCDIIMFDDDVRVSPAKCERRASVDPQVLQVKQSLDQLNRLFKGDASDLERSPTPQPQRPSSEQTRAAPEAEVKRIRLTVQRDGEQRVKATMLMTDTFSKLTEWLALQWPSEPGSQLQLFFSGDWLSAGATPQDMELEDDDVLDARFRT
eukprot:jgi/Astpho2/5130/Aster-06341